MFDFEGADVDDTWELKQIVDLGSPHFYEIKVKALEMEHQVVRNVFEACTSNALVGSMCKSVGTYRLTASTSFPPHDSHLYLLSPSMTSPST